MMKQRNKFISIVFGLVLFFCSFAYGEITAPRACPSGELVVINNDKESVWKVYPAEYSASFAVSDDGKTVYFASPKEGKVTFFAASVIDGLPSLESHSLYNGIEVPDTDEEQEPAPEPTPEPDTSLEGTIKTEVKKIKSDKLGEEINALSESFSSVIDGIDRGVIKTPEGARATFRAIWMVNASKQSNSTLNTYQNLITEISAKIDNTSIQTIRSDYERIVNALAPYDVVPKQNPVQTQTNTSNGTSCPNGRCKTNQNYQWGGYRWRQ